MALTLGDNFSYQGAKPLDARLTYNTLAAMKAVADATMYEGCLAYCTATGKTYQWKSTNTVDDTLGKWREFESGGSGGTSDYNDLDNLPKINNTEVKGNLTTEDLGIDIPTKTSELTNDSNFITDDDLPETDGAIDLSKFKAPGTTHNATDGSPVGTIISFFGYTAPSGYLACDGTEYAKADYPYLATHLADLDDHYSTTQYVGSDSDHFKVPDLQGEFLRGTGTNGHTNNGNGANVGVHQDSTYIKAVATGGSHEFWIATNNTDQTIVTNPDKQIMGTMGVDYYNRDIHSDNISTIEKQSLRPTNTSVLYCIKYN